MGASSSASSAPWMTAARAASSADRPGQPLELLAHALAQLSGRLLGERDGRHRAHVAGAAVGVEHAAHVAVDEHAGLARARPGLEQEGRCRGRW